MTLSVKEIQTIEATLPKPAITPLPKTAMNMHRVNEISKLGITPAESLEYAFMKNNSWEVREALLEHDLHKLFDNELEDHDAEDALEYAIENIPANILTTLLNAHGYQPIPKRKQALRDNAILVKPY